MVAWLSDWLRDIIAIILLAVFVELLLPNKAMQRYARLVVGLFILLTILSPILKLIQSDIGAKLDEGMDNWSKSANVVEMQMGGLNQINQNAEAMNQQRSLEAAKLTERTLEASIQNELQERTEAPIDKVDAVLKWAKVSGVQTPYISQVIVSLRAPTTDIRKTKDEAAVDVVQPVVVDIDVQVDLDKKESLESLPVGKVTEDERSLFIQSEKSKDKWSRADPATTTEIGSLIARGWGVSEEHIIVRQPMDHEAIK